MASFLSALYILAPRIPGVSSLVLLFAATAVPLALWSRDKEARAMDLPWETRLAEGPPALAFLFLGLVAAALIDFNRSWDALTEVVNSDRVALAGTGLIAAVFIGGSIVAWILKPFTLTLGIASPSQGPDLAHSGRYIGWFERAVLFALLVGGQPEAAVIAFAAKSFAARFPNLDEHQPGLPEYFLIGSLASLTIAVSVAAATRAALGIGPF
jgi:hypothetical protein